MPPELSTAVESSPARSPALLAPPVATKAPVEGEEADAASGVSAAKMLSALRRRWLVAVPLAAALAAVVYLGAESRLEPTYTARTMLHVSNSHPTLLYDNLGGRTETAHYQRNQIATLKSRLVRQAVVRDLEPLSLKCVRDKSDPLAWLEKEIAADFTVAPEIMRISMKGSDPDELLAVLNAVRDAYVREVLNRDRNDRATRLQQLNELAARHDAAVKERRQKIASKAETQGARDLPALRVKYEELTGQVHALQVELLSCRAAVRQSEAAPPPKDDPTPDPVAVESALEQSLATDPVGGELRKNIARLEKRVGELEARLVGYRDDPEYRQLNGELATDRAALVRRREALRAAAADQVRAGLKFQRTQDHARAARLGEEARQRLPVLDAEIRRQEKAAAEISGVIAELDQLRVEMAQQEEQLNLVNSKVRALEVELQAPPRARVVEEAVIVETPRWDRPLKMAGAPAVGAFLAVLLFVAWLDVRRGRVDGSADLESARIRVIGAVPSVPARVLPAFNPPGHDAARRDYLRLTDAVDMARAVIAPILASVNGYTLVVTSAAAGEGKTVLASHLAVRFARSGKRTLLIDTDVRRPQVHRLFGLRAGPGFGEWVDDQVDLADVAAPGPVPDLDVICAGNCDARTVAELLDRRFPELLRAVKDQYDVVILDTAPLLVASESLALARTADGVVLSVMRDVSRLPEVLACHERLAATNARVLGAIVTGDSPAQYAAY